MLLCWFCFEEAHYKCQEFMSYFSCIQLDSLPTRFGYLVIEIGPKMGNSNKLFLYVSIDPDKDFFWRKIVIFFSYQSI